MKLAESVDDSEISMDANVLDVLNPRREGGVVWKWEDKGVDTISRVGGEERIEEW